MVSNGYILLPPVSASIFFQLQCLPVIQNQGWICPKETLDIICRHFWLLQVGREGGWFTILVQEARFATQHPTMQPLHRRKLSSPRCQLHWKNAGISIHSHTTTGVLLLKHTTDNVTPAQNPSVILSFLGVNVNMFFMAHNAQGHLLLLSSWPTSCCWSSLLRLPCHSTIFGLQTSLSIHVFTQMSFPYRGLP